MNEYFLLKTETARDLFAACKNEPIYDYHCHLIPSQIAENYQMKDLADAWLSADHYKWRMMRAMGIDENLITGNAEGNLRPTGSVRVANGYDKFLAYAKTVENLIGNPLYHWTHLELQRYFDIYEPLTENSAPAIWEKANALLQKPELSVKGIFEKFKIHTVGTTDDPIDSLEHHKAIKDGTAKIGKIKTNVIPTFRPDKVMDLLDPEFPDYIEKLSEASGIDIAKLDDLFEALEDRLDFFIEHGCLSSDHGLEGIPIIVMPEKKLERAFNNALMGKHPSQEEAEGFKVLLFSVLSSLYAEKNIVMQLHTAVIRGINIKASEKLGANTGFDAINDCELSIQLTLLLNMLNSVGENGLPKIIFYSLNPKDYYPLATIMGGFQGDGIKGKMQLGSAWWFCDHRDGMEEQMRTLANLGVLPAFIGMLTDSRSFLSYPRHEYFRRIMCNLIGNWVEEGEYPKDMEKLEKIVKDISFNNAQNYFG